MELCISTWNYLINYGAATDLLAAVDEIVQNGYGLELFLNWHPDPGLFERSNWPAIKRRCGSCTRLSLHSRVTNTFSSEILREEIDLCRYLEADLLVLHPISLGVDAGTLELCPSVKLNDGDLGRILGIIRYAEEQGVLLALENGTTEILKWVRDQLKEKTDTKNFGICVDTGHANLHHERDHTYLLHMLEEFRNELVQVHISDNFGKKDDHALPGKGTIDWQGVRSTLVKIDFEGPFIFELRTPTPLESAEKAKAFMIELFDDKAR
jgi:sugar phosphate isomerase/epimerase